MLVNINAEMSEILSVYPHLQNLAAPFKSVEYENWVAEVGRSLYAKGGGDLVRKVLIELRHAPEDYSEDFLSYLTMKWPANLPHATGQPIHPCLTTPPPIGRARPSCRQLI